MDSRKNITGYCDGACKGNPGRGGWGCTYRYETETAIIEWTFYGGQRHTTNGEMELKAMYKLLKYIPVGNDITIYSDNKYVLDGMISGGKDGRVSSRKLGNDVVFTGYLTGWIAKGWKKAQGDAVKHISLWKKIVARCQEHISGGSTLHLLWVKGHSGDEGNDLADLLANFGVPPAK